MGFPAWTLWGMGLAAGAALISIALAFIAQTPRLLSRLGLVGSRLDLRARSLTGYGLAFLLLAMGFFIAGVPLGGSAAEIATGPTTGEPPVAGTITTEGMDQDGPIPTMPVQEAIAALETDVAPTRSTTSGAMGGLGSTVAATTDVGAVLAGEIASPTLPALTGDVLPADDAEATPTTPAELLATDTAPVAEAVNGAAATPEPTASPQPTATPRPTATPTATPTPTPIAGPTALINDNTSTLSIRRAPGGEPLVQVIRGDTVLLLPGRAFYGGALWREVSTVTGVVGWVQEQFLDYGGADG